MTVAQGLGLLAVAAWLYLLGLHGEFWRADQRLSNVRPGDRETWPAVACVIPARNEADTIAETVNGLLAQDYAGALNIVVVDDNSEDGTASLVPRDSRCQVVTGKPLAAGWTGKLWAMHQGVAAVAEVDAEYLLFTDADIAHDVGSISRLVAKAEADGLALTSLMVRLDASGFWGRLLIPAFVFFFQKLYPFPRVNQPNRRMAAAAGGCMLVRRAAFERAGGLDCIRGELIDDCALGRLMKGQGPIWLGLTRSVVSLRPYDGLNEIWRMVARTAFHQLSYSALLLVGCLLGLAVLYVAGPAVVIWGISTGDGMASGLGAAAWALMAAAYVPTVRLYDLPAAWAASLPLAGLFYGAMTADSARRHWLGAGGAWKGRTHTPTPAP